MLDFFVTIYSNRPIFLNQQDQKDFLRKQLITIKYNNLTIDAMIELLSLNVDSNLEAIENNLIKLRQHIREGSFLYFKDQIDIYKDFQANKSNLETFEQWQNLYFKYQEQQNNLLERSPALTRIIRFLNQKIKELSSNNQSIKPLLLTSSESSLRKLGESI